MAISRRKPAAKSLVQPSRRESKETLNNLQIPTWNPSKNYQKCSMIVSNRNASSGNVYTYWASYFLMEGNKRFTTTGRHATVGSMYGHADNDSMAAEPVVIQNSPPLERDEYFVDAVQGYIYLTAVTNKGNVYAGGYNDQGRLGHGDTTNRYALTKVTSTAGGVTFGPGGAKAVKVFATGASFATNGTTYIIDSEGKVYGCGYNGNNELGDNTTSQRNSFIRIGSLENIVNIFTNGYSAYALRNDGNLYVWGYNNYGQLGLGNTSNAVQPTLSTTNVKKLVSISDYECTYLLKNDGTVWFTGYAGTAGNNGLGDSSNRTSWTQITTNLSGRNVIDIVGGGTGINNRSAWALIDDGSIYSWGYNGYGQLGHNTTSNIGTPQLLTQPAGFPKVDKILTFGGASEYGFMAVNMASGRMFSVGNWCNGAIGVSRDVASGTWPIETPTVNRSHYPAREVESPAPVRDGYAKIKDVVQMTSNNSDQARVFVLLDDGTVWAKGSNLRCELGTKQLGIWYTSTYSYWQNSRYNATWRQVNF